MRPLPIAIGLLVGLLLASCIASAVAQDDDMTGMVIEFLSDSDKEIRGLALEQIGAEMKGEAATRKFAEALPTLAPEAQAGLLGALAVRGDVAARPAILALLEKTDDASVRVAAIESLGFLGGAEDAPLLVGMLVGGDDAQHKAAEEALVRLPGEDSPPAIVAEMRKASPEVHATLLGVLSARRALETIPEMLTDAVDENAIIRAAAMQSLGDVASPEHVPGMVQGVLKSEPGRERDAAEKAVMFVCDRIEDPAKQAAPLLAAMDELGGDDRLTMLSTLGRVGGPDARKVVDEAVGSSDGKTHGAGLRAACNWPDASIAPLLIDLVGTDAHEGHGKTALRALIRVAPLDDGRDDVERLKLLVTAMGLCAEPSERNMVLARAAAVRHVFTLRFVSPYLDYPPYAQQACKTIVELAHHRQLRDDNKALFHAALDRVVEISDDPIVIDRAKRYKAGQTWTGAQ